MTIRKGRKSDIKAIMKILENAVPLMNSAGNFQWDSTYPNENVFEKDIEEGQLWVVEIEETLAGFAAITTDQEPEYADAGWDINEVSIVTHRLAVDPKYRGMGVGYLLLNKAEDLAKSRGINFLRIDTNTNNTATQKLFPKCGYMFCGEISLKFRPGLRFYCYEKIIK